MINEKRSELEAFIRQQTLGPGAMRSRFVDKRVPITLSSDGHANYRAELINKAPAGIYSTGILFPEDHTKGAQTEVQSDSQAQEEDMGAERSEEIGSSSDDDLPEDPGDEEEQVNIDSQSLNQMYPNTMGLTVCLDPRVAEDNDLEIIVSGRYYEKVPLKDISSEIGVLLEQDKAVFQAFLDQLPKEDIIKKSVRVAPLDDDSNYIFLAVKDISTTDLNKRRHALAKEKAALFFDRADQKDSLETLKQQLFDQLRRTILPDSSKGKEIAEKIRQIEDIENSLLHIQDLISIHDTNDHGLWCCDTFSKPIGQEIEVPRQVRGKKIFSYKNDKYRSLKDLFKKKYAGKEDKWASLSASLQYSKFDHQRQKNDNLFLKIQIKNTSTPYSQKDTKNGKNYFSMVSDEVNKRSFFGVEVKVRSRYLRPTRMSDPLEKRGYDEDEVNRFIYRQFQDLGLGHGCSVRWGEENGRPFVCTEYVPTHEVPDVDTVPRHRSQFSQRTSDGYLPGQVFEDDQFLQFKWLSTLSSTSDDIVMMGMRSFVRAYGDWVSRQEDVTHPSIAQQIRSACLEDQQRMSRNVEQLLSQKEVIHCFRLMNTAMFMQLWHSKRSKEDTVDRMMKEEDFDGFTERFYKEKATDDVFPGIPHAAWRPFQLAFILMNLDGIFQREDDLEWAARNDLVDLVWFPTGGGKTEAYLGLIALTIVHRRRHFGKVGGGTAVMMRYTLRLLTTQQFQRATLLIMALELIRRWGTEDLGDEPIYIGLYVGKKFLEKALKMLRKEIAEPSSVNGKGRTSGSRLPISHCPWCGHILDPIVPLEEKGVYFDQRILIHCRRKDSLCAFATAYPEIWKARSDQGPLPVSFSDEEIYLHPPALLFGTVDKFAQLAHKVSPRNDRRTGDSRRLFGKGNFETHKPKSYRHPDLIIQDELHLMMGPLGSAVALFESAIDQLCTWEGNGKRIRPKVISSTATTRNTALQIMALFDRKVNIFPKPGVDCDDSFFAFYKRTAEDNTGHGMKYGSKRKYMGILPTGRTQMWMQLRLAAILFTHRAIFESEHLRPGDPFDPANYPVQLIEAMNYYHTVLAYYNSLREVGKTQSQVYSYLLKEIRRVFNIVVRPKMAMHCFYTYANCFHDGELTGRLSGEEAIESMNRIGINWSPLERLAHMKGDKKERGHMPPDLIIATNMISVGVDISRFNTMIVNCMPRNIAEYIQASSRVARDKAGLVITVHHPFRSRDLSHYERFIEFHEKMYSYVEPISITPFTFKALKRYLPLYIATMLRHQGFPDRRDANKAMDEYETEHWVRRLVGYFEKRMQRLHAMTDVSDIIKKLLEEENIAHINCLVKKSLKAWREKYEQVQGEGDTLVFNQHSDERSESQLYIEIDEYQDNITSGMWRIPQSLRVIDPEAVIHIKQK